MQVAKVKPSRREAFLNNKPREQEARTALVAYTGRQIADTEKQGQTLSANEQQLEKLSSAVIRAIRKDDLARQLKALERAAKELLQIDAQLAQINIKPKHVEDLNELERQIAILDAQLSAAAAHLAVEVKSAGTGQVRIGTARPKGTHSEPVLVPTKITVGDLAVITVTPAPNTKHESASPSMQSDRRCWNQSMFPLLPRRVRCSPNAVIWRQKPQGSVDRVEDPQGYWRPGHWSLPKPRAMCGDRRGNRCCVGRRQASSLPGSKEIEERSWN